VYSAGNSKSWLSGRCERTSPQVDFSLVEDAKLKTRPMTLHHCRLTTHSNGNVSIEIARFQSLDKFVQRRDRIPAAKQTTAFIVVIQIVTLGFGDVDAAFGRAATVVEAEIEIGRHTAVPLEPRALLADVDRRPARCRSTG